MKKKLLSLIAAVLIAVGPALGQIIVNDGDYNHNRSEQNVTEMPVMVPREGLYTDQWKHAPLGNGMLLLVGLGAAYLVGKRKKN